jgi:hypothetical protein
LNNRPFEQKTMNDILTAFLVPKKDLERFEQLNRSKEALTRSTNQPLPPRPTKMSSPQGSLPPTHSRSHSSISTVASEKVHGFSGTREQHASFSSLPVSASQELPPRGHAAAMTHDRRSTEFTRYDATRSSSSSSVVGGRSPSGAMTAR